MRRHVLSAVLVVGASLLVTIAASVWIGPNVWRNRDTSGDVFQYFEDMTDTPNARLRVMSEDEQTRDTGWINMCYASYRLTAPDTDAIVASYSRYVISHQCTGVVARIIREAGVALESLIVEATVRSLRGGVSSTAPPAVAITNAQTVLPMVDAAYAQSVAAIESGDCNRAAELLEATLRARQDMDESSHQTLDRGSK